MTRLSKQVVGNAGLYLICYELTKRGWNVLPTARNARGVDVVIYSEDASQMNTVQVKALSKRDAVPLGTKLDHLIADFFIVCTHVLGDVPRVFTMFRSDVRCWAHRDAKGNYWLEPASYEPYEGRWDLIGRGNEAARRD